MSSDIDICNLALTHVGKRSINALTEALTEAVSCKNYYPHVRRTMLQSSAWTFAKRREAMAQIDNDFTERWAYAYARPNGALTVLQIVPAASPRFAGPTIPFEVRENRIYTAISPATVDIVYDLTDASRYSPLFVDLMAYKLAEYLARGLVRSPALAREMSDAATRAKSLAIAADAAQDAPTYVHDGEEYRPGYTEARGTDGGYGSSW
jgi:hypothetical protein